MEDVERSTLTGQSTCSEYYAAAVVDLATAASTAAVTAFLNNFWSLSVPCICDTNLSASNIKPPVQIIHLFIVVLLNAFFFPQHIEQSKHVRPRKLRMTCLTSILTINYKL